MNRKKSSKNENNSIISANRMFPIVGIGASAGGLEAITQLLTALPSDAGLALVFIQHLAPKHESMSAEIFSRHTRMPVVEVKGEMRVEPNHVYVLPPNYGMKIVDRTLKLIPRTKVPGLHLPIDFFFQSLAEDQQRLAVGIVLSGTGSDGTAGLLAIKAGGGITFSQDLKSAKYEDMPKSAIGLGAVDMILSPQEIAEELVRIAHHPYIMPTTALSVSSPVVTDKEPLKFHNKIFSKILNLLRSHSHVDFTHYKPGTIQRRIERRMILQKMENTTVYVQKYFQSL